MGYWNSRFAGHRIDFQTYPQDHNHLHPKPGILYGSVASYPPPSAHPAIVDLRPAHNPNSHHMPENHDNTFYMMPQYNGIQPQPQPRALNLDLSVAAPGIHYNPCLPPPYGIRDFSLEVSQGPRNELCPLLTQRMVGLPTDSYARNMQYVDNIRGSFKRNNVEAIPANNQYHAAPAGSSSSNALMAGRSAESNIPSVNALSFRPPEYGGNETTQTVETGFYPSVRNLPGLVGPESSLAPSSNHMNQGNYFTSQIPLSGNPWFGQPFGASNGDIGTFAWTQVPELPFVCASENGACVEMGNMHVQGHQPTTGSASSYRFLNPPIPQGHSNSYLSPPLHMHGASGYEFNFPPRVATSSNSLPGIRIPNNGINPFHDAAAFRPLFLASVPETGFRFYQPQLREIMPGSNVVGQSLPHLRVLPEDEVACLEIPHHHETGDTIDQHMDMRLDIDHMSYEELLALGERIGSVGTGLPEEFIQTNLKTRTFTSMSRVNLEETPSLDAQIQFCVICQTDYKDAETNGIIECGHEYHHECIKKWLLQKNSCPVCKSTALSISRKDK